jgi:hypothetical protein
MSALNVITVLATEAGALEEGQIAYTSWLAKVAVPLGILVFLGGPYLLLRSNLGTLRAYLVLATSFFGLMFILSLFWGFGAPGTPPNTGPTNLPGQVAEYYRPTWVPFAEDSTLASQEPYASLIADPERFNTEQVDAADPGIEPTKAFFASEEGGDQVGDTWDVAEGPFYAIPDNGQPVMRIVFGATYQADSQGNLPEGVDEGEVGNIDPDGERFTAYAFFDAGNPFFPSLVFILLSIAGFVLHAALLVWDENRERREAREVVVEDAERVPAGATAAR